jgi:hypothetical protein
MDGAGRNDESEEPLAVEWEEENGQEAKCSPRFFDQEPGAIAYSYRPGNFNQASAPAHPPGAS